ncbi:MAG: hypothetical protein WC624_06410, partial [Candidatus Margulisiibacteriota bacterium]
MKNILSVMLPILLLLSCSAMASDKMLTYQNQDFGFAVDYPSTYRLDEIKWVKESTGVTLSTKESSITVQAMPTGTNYANVPFDEYVRIAASSEIQNFNKLASIESFVSDYMIKGYKTWWEANEHQDLDGSSINSTSIVGPIYYFAPEIKQKLSGQPVKVIMISCFSPSGEESALKMDMENVAKSFRYVASIKMFFKKGNHGKQYVIEKRK